MRSVEKPRLSVNSLLRNVREKPVVLGFTGVGGAVAGAIPFSVDMVIRGGANAIPLDRLEKICTCEIFVSSALIVAYVAFDVMRIWNADRDV
jgi:hypothetical protein